MNSIFKPALISFALVGLLTACGSNTSTSDQDAASAEAERAAAEAAAAAEATRLAAAEQAAAEAKAKCASLDRTFYFDFDQSILSSEARVALMAHAQCFKTYGGSIRLEGHADERGSREYNMALGERRANAVRDFLSLQGVSAGTIETVSYGEEKPAEVGSYESAWSKNRRVELK